MAGRSLNLLLVGLIIWSGLCISWEPVMGQSQLMGINYGLLGDNLPTPQQSVALMKQMNVGKVRIYDTNPVVLNAFANSGLEVSISVTTDLITGLGTSAATADQWIANNVVAYPSTLITGIIVGNELFSNLAITAIWSQILPAMNNLQASLVARNLNTNVKITTALAMDILAVSYPPSAGTFRSDIATTLMQPILQFISTTQSSLFLNVYPYFAWAGNSAEVSIDYALFATGVSEVVVMDGAMKYTSMLDAQVDAVVAAMERVGFGTAGLTISETGWPSGGDATTPGATVPNAATYNNRLVQKTMTNPPIGTPRRPGQTIPTYLFALFDENLKPGLIIEKYWGLLYADGSPIYSIDLTGTTVYLP